MSEKELREAYEKAQEVYEFIDSVTNYEDSHAGLRKARGQNLSGFGQFFLEFIEGKRYFFTEIEETVHVFTKEKGHETFPSSDWWEGSYTNEERFKGKKIVLKFSYLYESISSGGKR